MVANRLSVKPLSKLAGCSWVAKRAFICNLAEVTDDQCYRAMDFLLGATKAVFKRFLRRTTTGKLNRIDKAVITAEASASRTVRRWTLWRLARARIDRPSTRRPRRIRSNCSTLDTPISLRQLSWSTANVGGLGSGVGPFQGIKVRPDQGIRPTAL